MYGSERRENGTTNQNSKQAVTNQNSKQAVLTNETSLITLIKSLFVLVEFWINYEFQIKMNNKVKYCI